MCMRSQMMIIKTKNSTYEIINGYIRRVKGSKDHNPIGDGWITFKMFLLPPDEGQCMTLLMEDYAGGDGRVLRTSKVIKISDDLDDLSSWSADIKD